MKKDLTPRQQTVYDLIVEMSANGALKITNERLSSALLERKGMSGFDGKQITGAAAGAYLKILKKLELIELVPGETTRDRIILIKNTVLN